MTAKKFELRRKIHATENAASLVQSAMVLLQNASDRLKRASAAPQLSARFDEISYELCGYSDRLSERAEAFEVAESDPTYDDSPGIKS